MENFLSNFANTNTQVQSNNANLSVSPEFHGTIDISKGALTMKIYFYARMYKMKYDNCVSLDDWDINDTSDISFAGMPIDNLSALKTMLTNSGLTTVANELVISNDDYKKEICNQIENNKAFKYLFGKKAIFFSNLTKIERDKIMLRFAIDNYGNDKVNISSELNSFLVKGENDTKVQPTLEQLEEMYNSLKQ